MQEPQPIRNGGLANLALDRLGLPPIEGAMINRAQDLLLDRPREATWVGDDPQSGDVGDATQWMDPRNWVRGGVVDERIDTGDALFLSQNAELQTISLPAIAPRVKSLDVAGQYRLDGRVVVNTGRIHIEPDGELQVAGDLRTAESLIIDGGGEVTVGGSIDDALVLSGTLSVYGSIDGSLAYGGTLSPSHEEIGTLNIAEDFRQTGNRDTRRRHRWRRTDK